MQNVQQAACCEVAMHTADECYVLTVQQAELLRAKYCEVSRHTSEEYADCTGG